ncbi:MAG: DUF5368 family protein [Rhodospirillaceae bacterium]
MKTFDIIAVFVMFQEMVGVGVLWALIGAAVVLAVVGILALRRSVRAGTFGRQARLPVVVGVAVWGLVVILLPGLTFGSHARVSGAVDWTILLGMGFAPALAMAALAFSVVVFAGIGDRRKA